MATVYTANYLKLNPTDGSPVEFIDSGDVKGQILCAYDEYTQLAELADGDFIQTGIKIPKGARVHSVAVEKASDGTTGIVQFMFGSTLVGSATAFDFGSAALNLVAPLFHEASVEEAVLLECLEASVASTGDTFKIAVYYTVV